MSGCPKIDYQRYKTLCFVNFLSFHHSMPSKKTIRAYALPSLCILQYLGIIGYCLYKLYSDSEKTELWTAIICSVLGCISSKAHLLTKTKKRDVILPGDSVGLESEILSK